MLPGERGENMRGGGSSAWSECRVVPSLEEERELVSSGCVRGEWCCALAKALNSSWAGLDIGGSIRGQRERGSWVCFCIAVVRREVGCLLQRRMQASGMGADVGWWSV